MHKQHRKQEKLGMNPSTASGRLVKDLLFDFAIKAGHKCYRCGKELTRDTFSIEHKESWLHSENPLKVYFDIDNIAYSHLKCNSEARERRPEFKAKCGTNSKYTSGCKCKDCTKANTEYVRNRYTPEARRAKYEREKLKV